LKTTNKPINRTSQTMRKAYQKPQIEVVPLLPKQTVLGVGCFTTSDQSGEQNYGCGIEQGMCVQI